MLEEIRKTIKGNTTKEKLEDVEYKMFMVDMIDRWTEHDREYLKCLEKIKEELEKEINERK